MCISPITVKNKYRKNKNDPVMISYPCGRCHECRLADRSEWAFRLEEEYKVSKGALFLTLTYDNEHLPTVEYYDVRDGLTNVGVLSKRHVQLFLKRLRKELPDTKLRYYVIGEYGSNTLRPHYHMILFNVNIQDHNKIIAEKWQYGNVHFGTAERGSFMYTAKYSLKFNESKRYWWLVFNVKGFTEQFRLMSKCIGCNYIKRMKDYHDRNLIPYVINSGGFKQQIPRYFKRKLFSHKNKDIMKQKFLEFELEREEKVIKLYPDTIDQRRIESIQDAIRKFNKINNEKL